MILDIEIEIETISMNNTFLKNINAINTIYFFFHFWHS